MTLIYEDHLISISLSSEPVAVGHLVVEPKEKFSEITELSDELVEHLFFGASYAATALFELAHAQGTNIILTEHDVKLQVISRTENDGLDLLWQPTQGNQQELNSLAKSIQDHIDEEVWKKDNPQQKKSSTQQTVMKMDEPQDEEVDPSQGKKINYLMKSLERVP